MPIGGQHCEHECLVLLRIVFLKSIHVWFTNLFIDQFMCFALNREEDCNYCDS
uniref:Uncharacterized protein n=1 Tax=Rhizophora mucronata TaxID=61149 RepID=A0A2P2QW00_RHIMU